jgi:hypothetical protein
MSEHWKSTPRYWCKHCSTYVRDTQLERQNHESTAKHQGNLKRFLRDLHRGHEREEREKERARQEIARVTGVVAGSSSAASSLRSTGAQHAKSGAPSEAELKRQREQLAELGVAMPSEIRPEMAIPGEWTVTKTRVIKDDVDGGDAKKEATATGVRKRGAEEDKEEEEALQGLFKKPRKWGRDSRAMPQEEDSELDALLSGSILTRPTPSEDTVTKREEEPSEGIKQEVKEEVKEEDDNDAVKKEPDDEAPQGLTIPVKKEEEPALDRPVKPEESEGGPAPVVFRKRKPKGMLRQK